MKFNTKKYGKMQQNTVVNASESELTCMQAFNGNTLCLGSKEMDLVIRDLNYKGGI